jgi:predicted nucleotidyltransferase
MVKIYKIHGPPKFSRTELIRKLRSALHGRAYQAFVFGSYAARTATSSSDVDLLVIADSRRPFVERFRDFTDIVQRFAPIDLVVYTPAEWHALIHDPTPFWAYAKKTWVPLFSASEQKHQKTKRVRS